MALVIEMKFYLECQNVIDVLTVSWCLTKIPLKDQSTANTLLSKDLSTARKFCSGTLFKHM